MGLEGAGFFLVYEPRQRESLCPVSPSATAKEQGNVPVYVGGEPMEVPRRHFLDKETAWAVIDDFLRDGQPSPRVRWEAWR